MAKHKSKLELTWVGKDNRPRLEPRILVEDPEKSYHARHRVSENDIFDNRLIFGDNLLALKGSPGQPTYDAFDFVPAGRTMSRIRRWSVLTSVVCVLALAAGCARVPHEPGAPPVFVGRGQPISAYGIMVYRNSEPREVARLFIAALDNEDSALLRRLIAGKAEKQRLDKFARLRGIGRATVDDALDVAVLGWLGSYSYFRKESMTVTTQSLSGSEARVSAQVLFGAAGEPRTIEIVLVREDGWWKVSGGPKTQGQ